MGYLMLFHEIGLDYTWSTYASEGEFRPFHISRDDQETECQDLYRGEAAGVKWILGENAAHVARPAPVHGHHERSDRFSGRAGLADHGYPICECQIHQDVHITEFTADLIRHNKLKLDLRRNDRLK